MKQISQIRKEIDKVDGELLRLLEKRMGLVLQLRDCKRLNNLPVEDTAREEEILGKLSGSQLDSEFVRDVYGKIFSYSKKIQR